MQTNTPANLRRSERQPATIPISLVLKAETFMVDNSATAIDISLGGMRVRTTLELVPGGRVGIVAQGEFPHAIPTRIVWVQEDKSSYWTFAGLEFLLTLEA